MQINEREGVVFAQPTTMGERGEIAEACTLGLKIEMSMLLDEIDIVSYT